MLYYKETGDKNGKLILFIHGGFTTSESYEKQYHLLEQFHCVYVDLPNHGKSGYGKEYRFSYEKAAQELIELMEELSPREKVMIVSHSYGGLVTKLLLEKVPHRIEKVVIGSTNVLRTPLYWIYTRVVGCAVLWSQNKERYKRENISWKLVRQVQKDAWKNFRIAKQPCTAKIQALLLYAEYDIQAIKDSMGLWEKYLPQARLLMIQGADHNYFWNKPDEVNPMVKNFIESTDGADFRCRTL